MTCPEACKKEQEHLKEGFKGFKLTLFGKEGTGGLVGCLNKKVPKAWLWPFAVVLIILVGGLAGWAMNDRDKIKDSVASKATFEAYSEVKASCSINNTMGQVNAAKIQNVEVHIVEIKEAITALSVNQIKMNTDMPKLIKDAVEEAVKK